MYTSGGPDGGDFEEFLEAGIYYIIISSWAPPQTVDYLINLSFQGLGVDDDKLQSSINILPNPTFNKFTVSINNTGLKDIILEMIDISGQVVYHNQVKSVYGFNEEIDATSFARGIYYLRVIDGVEIIIEKVIIH